MEPFPNRLKFVNYLCMYMKWLLWEIFEVLIHISIHPTFGRNIQTSLKVLFLYLFSHRWGVKSNKGSTDWYWGRKFTMGREEERKKGHPQCLRKVKRICTEQWFGIFYVNLFSVRTDWAIKYGWDGYTNTSTRIYISVPWRLGVICLGTQIARLCAFAGGVFQILWIDLPGFLLGFHMDIGWKLWLFLSSLLVGPPTSLSIHWTFYSEWVSE